MVERATKRDHEIAPELDNRAEVEEWEEPLHPGSLRANLSHFLPQCNPNFTFSPTSAARGPPDWRQNARSMRPFVAGPAPAPAGATSRNRTHAAAARCNGWLQHRTSTCAHRPRTEYDRRPRPPIRRHLKERRLAPPSPPSTAHRRGTRASRRARRARAHRARRCPLAREPCVAARAGAACSGCGSSHRSASARRPGARRACFGAALRRRDRAPRRRAEDGRAGRRAKALTHQADPYLRLLELLRTPGSPPLDYASDVAPVARPAGRHLRELAERLGRARWRRSSSCCSAARSTAAFPFSAHGAQGAIVLDTTDAGKARSFLESQARLAGAHAGQLSRGLLRGERRRHRLRSGRRLCGHRQRSRRCTRVIDTTLADPPCSTPASYAKLLAVAPPDTLAHVYSNPAPVRRRPGHARARRSPGGPARAARGRTHGQRLARARRHLDHARRRRAHARRRHGVGRAARLERRRRAGARRTAGRLLAGGRPR